ncbi:MAG: hypothetical protein ABJX82_18780, partial [Paracoccaceae bacterium]
IGTKSSDRVNILTGFLFVPVVVPRLRIYEIKLSRHLVSSEFGSINLPLRLSRYKHVSISYLF